jgi:uncharacterized membrane protein
VAGSTFALSKAYRFGAAGSAFALSKAYRFGAASSAFALSEAHRFGSSLRRGRLGLPTAAFRLPTSDFRLLTSDFRLKTVHSRPDPPTSNLKADWPAFCTVSTKFPDPVDRASQTEPQMKSMYKRNISTTERWASALIGGALAAVGYRRDNRGLGLAGLGMLVRGATGFCPVSAAVGRDTSNPYDTRARLGGSRGVMVDASTTIYRPIQEVYAYWRSFENLPLFMDHLEDVQDISGSRSHWVAKGPMSMPVEWDAEIINDVPPELISWKTVGESDVVSAGSVRFKQAPGDHGTEVRVKLQYDPPAGKVGATVAWMLGDDPQTAIEEDLRRFKQLVETGEISTGERYRARSNARLRRDSEAAAMMTEPIPNP